MRLLHIDSFKLIEFFDDNIPKYAILSHTWEEEEVLFRDMKDVSRARRKHGFAKVQGACRLARSQGYKYIWIDTCCINKYSSAELTEAINSMYRWYKEAAVCYAFLSDIGPPLYDQPHYISRSRWFTRGWTLQELIAPEVVEFYNNGWEKIGDKRDSSLCPIISEVTRIDQKTLRGQDPSDTSIARRMYWASKRETTRVEDLAYSLLGLFDVNMPLIYGEGHKAFRRLQEEILRTTDDQSIFAWHNQSICEGTPVDILAQRPSDFAESGAVSAYIPYRVNRKATSITNQGIVVELPILSVPNPLHTDYQPFAEVEAILDCQLGSAPGTFPTIRLRAIESRGQDGAKHYYRVITQDMTKLKIHDSRALLTDVDIIGFDPTQLEKNEYREVIDKYNWSWKVETLIISRSLPKDKDSGRSTQIPWSLSLLHNDYHPDDTPFWITTFMSDSVVSLKDAYPKERWDESMQQLQVQPIPRECFGVGKFCRIEGIFDVHSGFAENIDGKLDIESIDVTLLVGRQSESRRASHPKPWVRLLEPRIEMEDAAAFMEKYNDPENLEIRDEKSTDSIETRLGRLVVSVRAKEVSGRFYYVVALYPVTSSTVGFFLVNG